MSARTANLAVPARALAIAAHPDDVEFGCGGTLAKWAAAGSRIHHLVLTDGSKGSWDPDEDTAKLIALRQDEQRAASRALGGRGDVTFLAWPDGELEPGIDQRRDVAAVIRKVRPDVVLGHDPWRRYRLHPDHRAAGFLATDGIVAARDPHFFPELVDPPHRPASLLLWEADQPDHVEDITGHLDAKVAALLEHRSQWRSTMHIEDPSKVAAFNERVTTRAREAATPDEFAYGEEFKLITEL